MSVTSNRSVSLGELPAHIETEKSNSSAALNSLCLLQSMARSLEKLEGRVQKLEFSLLEQRYPAASSSAASSSSSDDRRLSDIQSMEEARTLAVCCKTGTEGSIEALKCYHRALELANNPSDKAQLYCEVGLIKWELENYKSAEDDFNRAIGLCPKLFEAHLYLIQVFKKQKKNLHALQYANKVIQMANETPPVKARALFLSAKILAEKKEGVRQALQDLELAIRIYPEMTDLYILRIEIFIKYFSHTPIPILGGLERVLKKEPKNYKALSIRGLIHLNEGRLSEAEEYLSQALEYNHHHSKTYYYRAKLRYKLGDYLAALRDLELVADKYQNDFFYRHLKADLLRELGYPDEALNILLNLQEADPDNKRLLPFLAEVYTDKKEYAKAKQLIDRAIENSDTEPLSYIAAANWHTKQGKYKEALAVLSCSLEEKPCPHILRERARIYLTLEKYQLALEDLANAHHLLPDDPYLLAELGLLETINGQVEQGAEKIRKCVETVNKGSKLSAIIGTYNYFIKSYEETKRHLDYSIQENPLNPLGLTYRALLAIRQESFAEAHADLSLLLKQNPYNPYIHALIAIIYQEQGKMELARASCMTALMYNDESDLARFQLEQIDEPQP